MMKYITTSQQDMLKSIGQYRRGLILSHIRLSKYCHLKYSVKSLVKLPRKRLIELNKDMREGKTLLVEFLPKTEQNKLENISYLKKAMILKYINLCLCVNKKYNVDYLISLSSYEIQEMSVKLIDGL